MCDDICRRKKNDCCIYIQMDGINHPALEVNKQAASLQALFTNALWNRKAEELLYWDRTGIPLIIKVNDLFIMTLWFIRMRSLPKTGDHQRGASLAPRVAARFRQSDSRLYTRMKDQFGFGSNKTGILGNGSNSDANISRSSGWCSVFSQAGKPVPRWFCM